MRQFGSCYPHGGRCCVMNRWRYYPQCWIRPLGRNAIAGVLGPWFVYMSSAVCCWVGEWLFFPDFLEVRKEVQRSPPKLSTMYRSSSKPAICYAVCCRSAIWGVRERMLPCWQIWRAMNDSHAYNLHAFLAGVQEITVNISFTLVLGLNVVPKFSWANNWEVISNNKSNYLLIPRFLHSRYCRWSSSRCMGSSHIIT